jgi:uncharacterized membrane protein YqiK
MSTPREFQIVPCQDNTYQAFLNLTDVQLYRAIPVIEKTPEVVRKLECFDELVKAFEYCFDKYAMEYMGVEDEKIRQFELLSRKAKGE